MELSKNKIKYIQSLKDKKKRSEYGVFVAEGNKMISDLLPLMRCQLLVATQEFMSQNKVEASIETVIVSPQELGKASFLKNPQQALAVFYQQQYQLDMPTIENGLSLVLDGIQDPGNMGTIIRLADWYGIENIICSLDTADVYNPKVVQATMGALARVKVHYLDLVHFLKKVKDVPIYGMLLDGENMYEKKLTQTGLIVMGNEGNGMSGAIESFISEKLFIPNYPMGSATSESLNVAIATAIVCAEFRRRFLK